MRITNMHQILYASFVVDLYLVNGLPLKNGL